MQHLGHTKSDKVAEASWKEIIQEREEEERRERDRQLEEGRKAWAEIQEAIRAQPEINHYVERNNK